MKNKKYSVIGIALSLTLLVLLINFIGTTKVLETILRLNFFYFILAILAFLCVILINIVCLFLFFSELPEKVSIDKIGRFYIKSWALSTILPGKIGEFALAYFLKEKIPLGKSVAVILLDKIISLIILSLLSIAALLYFSNLLPTHIILAYILFLWGIIMVLLNKNLRGFLRKILGKYESKFRGFSSTLSYLLKNRRKVLLNMLFTFLRIIISALISELLFMGLGIVPNILVLIFSISLMSIVTFMPLTANGLGLKQWIFTVTMGSTGIGISMAGTVALVATAIEYGIILILTLLFGTITEQHDA